MSLSKKHFEGIAKAVGTALYEDSFARYKVGSALADYLVEQNPNFQRARFILAIDTHAEKESQSRDITIENPYFIPSLLKGD